MHRHKKKIGNVKVYCWNPVNLLIEELSAQQV